MWLVVLCCCSLFVLVVDCLVLFGVRWCCLLGMCCRVMFVDVCLLLYVVSLFVVSGLLLIASCSLLLFFL